MSDKAFTGTLNKTGFNLRSSETHAPSSVGIEKLYIDDHRNLLYSYIIINARRMRMRVTVFTLCVCVCVSAVC